MSERVPEPPNKRVGWSIYFASVVVSSIFCGLLAPFRVFPLISGRSWFFLAIGLGCALAITLNLLRPHYDRAGARWGAFYDYLLRQLTPPD